MAGYNVKRFFIQHKPVPPYVPIKWRMVEEALDIEVSCEYFE